ncbi:MAG: DUF308 domain-containing protein [Chthoniobacterales bacterium]
MSDATPPASHQPAAPKSRGWIIFFAIASILVGVLAILFPTVMALAIEQVIGIFCVVSGVFSIGNVIFGGEKGHRTSSVVLAIIRLAAGLVLLTFPMSGVLSLALILGVFFVAEGLVFIAGALGGISGVPKGLMLVNGIVALVLGVMVFLNFPSDAPEILGLLYGINSIFYGITLFSLLGTRPPAVHG